MTFKLWIKSWTDLIKKGKNLLNPLVKRRRKCPSRRKNVSISNLWSTVFISLFRHATYATPSTYIVIKTVLSMISFFQMLIKRHKTRLSSKRVLSLIFFLWIIHNGIMNLSWRNSRYPTKMRAGKFTFLKIGSATHQDMATSKEIKLCGYFWCIYVVATFKTLLSALQHPSTSFSDLARVPVAILSLHFLFDTTHLRFGKALSSFSAMGDPTVVQLLVSEVIWVYTFFFYLPKILWWASKLGAK